MMKDGVRSIIRLNDMEALRFMRRKQPFSSHFHKTYVIGQLEKGEQCLGYEGGRWKLHAGNLVLFSPSQRYACVPESESKMDYRSLSVS